MQLTKQTDFAFRVLLYLGKLEGGARANIREICEFYDISRNHVAKVVLKLTRLGYISSVRGQGGGIERINVAQVVRDFEATLRPINCETPRCRLSPDCHLKSILFVAMEGFLASLSAYTLADLLANEITL